MKDHCGIFGVFSQKPGYRAAFAAYDGLVALQHRGQDACGICAFDGNDLKLVKDHGLVCEVFTRGILDSLPGTSAIGHVRYPTTGSADLRNAQPFRMSFRNHDFAFAFNGNIANYLELRKKMMGKGLTFISTTEIELIGMLFSAAINRTGDIYAAAAEVMGELDGSYSLLAIDGHGSIYALRDPQGFKPFCAGQDGKGNWFFASESCALESLGVAEWSDIKPGELVKVSAKEGLVRKQVVEPRRVTHCMFEFLYFARGDSVMDGRLNNEVRERLGESLARSHPVKADYVVPVPDSGRSFALGYSRVSGIPYEECLMKNRYVFRTFIMPEQGMREKAVRAKLNPVRKFVAGKSIVLLEDSIVRGTTLKAIVGLLRGAGAREVHVRVGCPPVIAPCYMGMDFPTHEELLAARLKTEEGIAKELGADSVGYTDLAALNEAIGLPGELCMACLTGKYPLKKAPKQDQRITCC